MGISGEGTLSPPGQLSKQTRYPGISIRQVKPHLVPFRQRIFYSELDKIPAFVNTSSFGFCQFAERLVIIRAEMMRPWVIAYAAIQIRFGLDICTHEIFQKPFILSGNLYGNADKACPPKKCPQREYVLFLEHARVIEHNIRQFQVLFAPGYTDIGFSDTAVWSEYLRGGRWAG